MAKKSLREFAEGKTVEELLGTPALREKSSTKKQPHPQAGIVWKNKTEGTITSKPSASRDVRWDELLTEWGYNPEEFEIVEPVSLATWDGYGKNSEGVLETVTLWSRKAGIRRRRVEEEKKNEDYELLLQELRDYKPKPPATGRYISDPEPVTRVVLLSDWQLGNSDGDGTEGTVRRIQAAGEKIRDRLNDEWPETLVVGGLGDIHENCSGFYPMQSFTVQLDRREQETLSRRLLVQLLKLWSPLTDRVLAVAVGGNHGENRNETGKAYTTFADNTDVSLFEQVAEILSENRGFDHIEWIIPKGELAVTVEVGGTVLGFAHGHQAGSAANAQARVKDWWQKMAFANDALADVDYLCTGHFHHFSMVQYGKRYHIQAPAMNSASSWFAHTGGDRQNPGMLTFVLRADGTFTDLEIV